MNWRDFELLVGEHFQRQGVAVEETAGGADGGVDLLATKNGEKYLIQCKQWKVYKVGVKVVRELLGVMVGDAATGGFVVTSGKFTRVFWGQNFILDACLLCIKCKNLTCVLHETKVGDMSKPESSSRKLITKWPFSGYDAPK